MDPDAPLTPLAKREIEKGLQPRRGVKITFIGEGSPPGEICVTSSEDAHWKDLLVAARDYLQYQIDIISQKAPHHG